MEDPLAYRRNCACIIRRYIQRVQARNYATAAIQNIIYDRNDPINECTVILGTPTSAAHDIDRAHDIDCRVWFYMCGGNGRYYAHDVRELYHMLKHGYAGACCPYTRRPFTKYEKYYAVRMYHRICADGVPDLDLDAPPSCDIDEIARELSALLNPYGMVNVRDIQPGTWYTLLHDLAVNDRFRMGTYILLYNQAQYHYLQGNGPAFLHTTWKLLTAWIKESPAPESTATMLSMQLTIVPAAPGLPLDLLGMISMFADDPVDILSIRPILPAPPVQPVPRQAEAPPDGERPAQRRRID